MHGILRLGVILSFLVLLLGPSRAFGLTDPAPPILTSSTILVLSDCLAEAYGFDPDQSWVLLLSKRLSDQQWPYQVVNISNSGDTTQQGLEKLPEALKQYHPALVIVALGSNDGLRGFPTPFIYENLSQITALIQGYPAKILLVRLGLPTNYGPVYQKQFSSIFDRLEERYHLSNSMILIDAISSQAQNKQFDNLHPSAEAQQVILDALWPAIKRNLRP
ncbi:MAG: arylesterase [Gammaproteobacteria bacterium]|nr:arylesterase [Gammaproteobacteria bacterium]MBP9729089.1 arylesterase [Gammaproteobacteria bacterium]